MSPCPGAGKNKQVLCLSHKALPSLLLQKSSFSMPILPAEVKGALVTKKGARKDMLLRQERTKTWKAIINVWSCREVGREDEEMPSGWCFCLWWPLRKQFLLCDDAGSRWYKVEGWVGREEQENPGNPCSDKPDSEENIRNRVEKRAYRRSHGGEGLGVPMERREVWEMLKRTYAWRFIWDIKSHLHLCHPHMNCVHICK